MSATAPIALGAALDAARMGAKHRRIWLLAGLGILLDGFDFFIIGVANPLIAEEWGLSAAQKGLVSAAAIVGAIVGAGLLGPLGDKFGRARLFKYDLWLFVVFSLLCVVAWDVWSLIAFRFLLGIAIGLDYPIAASYLAEVLPRRDRGRWLVGAFSLQAAGILLGALVGVGILLALPEVESWRLMLGFGVVPALIIIWLRRGTPESPRWLASHGREEEAIAVTEELVGHPVVVTDEDRGAGDAPPEGLRALIQPKLFGRALRRRTAFTAIPWFLMDIATYGVGIFTPTLLAAMALAGPDATFISDDIASTEGTAALDVFLVLGFITAIFLVDKLGRVPLQLVGFAMMGVALALLAIADGLAGGGEDHLWLVFLGFALFNFFMNAGPNATTYALPAEVFPEEVRAAGHGFAAACAKFGAALGVFLFPILQDDIGTSALLAIISGLCVVAFFVTVALRIEPKGRSLAELSGRDTAELSPHPVPP
ncbi:MAG: MFS transporter [Solirubrobacteraceae bacterium]|nr:MFS transporter [Solirubrobacteraceae bacterium]